MNESALIRCALQHSATLIIQLCDLVVPLDLIIRIYISLRKEKELSFCRKLKFSNPYICAAEWFKPLIFQTLNIYSNRIHSLKHLWFTRLDCKDIRIRKSEFVAKTQFLYQKFKKCLVFSSPKLFIKGITIENIWDRVLLWNLPYFDARIWDLVLSWNLLYFDARIELWNFDTI